jgi:hypothetical protein
LWGRGWSSHSQPCSCWNVGQRRCTHVPQNMPTSGAKSCRDMQSRVNLPPAPLERWRGAKNLVLNVNYGDRQVVVRCLAVSHHTATHGGLTPPSIDIIQCRSRGHQNTVATSWHQQSKRSYAVAQPAKGRQHIGVVSSWLQSQHQCITRALVGARFIQAPSASGLLLGGERACPFVPICMRPTSFVSNDHVASF